MKRSLSTYIRLTAKSSIDIHTLLKLSNTQKIVVLVRPFDKKKSFLPEVFILFRFLKIHDQLVDTNAF